jgi:hypothetical protein
MIARIMRDKAEQIMRPFDTGECGGRQVCGENAPPKFEIL